MIVHETDDDNDEIAFQDNDSTDTSSSESSSDPDNISDTEIDCKPKKHRGKGVEWEDYVDPESGKSIFFATSDEVSIHTKSKNQSKYGCSSNFVKNFKCRSKCCNFRMRYERFGGSGAFSSFFCGHHNHEDDVI